MNFEKSPDRIMEFKITKRTLLREVNNDMCHNWYWLVQGQIINDEGTRYRKFKFVEWFDVFDVQEWAEDGTHSKKNVREYLDECISARLALVNGYNDCRYFYEVCNQTIERYNNVFCSRRNYAY